MRSSSLNRQTRQLGHEQLEPRLLLAGDLMPWQNYWHAEGEGGSGVNGPHASDPSYDLSSFHIHADLSIYVDSQQVTIPSGVGNPLSGGADIHTHDDTGQIHIHPQAPRSEFVTLGDIFDIWSANPATGSPDTIQLSDTQLFDNVVDNVNRLQLFVNGIEVDEAFADYQIHDTDNLVLIYGSNPVISFNTNAGSIPLELLADEAPNTVDYFLAYVNGGVDGQGFISTVLHRSEPNFVIQGGGYRPTSLTTTDLAQIQGSFIPDEQGGGKFEHHIPAFAPIPDERGPDSRSNVFGTVAMVKNSAGATSEYFFNFNNNSGLDVQGFTVFAIALGMATPGGAPVASATINEIEGFTRVDVDPSNDTTGGFSVFDNVPFTPEGEMVAIESISGDGAVRGTVFADTDRDGVLDAGETGLGGVLVFSDANGNGAADDSEFSVRTDADGSYSLVLPAGEHTIRQESDVASFQNLVTLPSSSTITVPIGGTINDVDFGNSEAGSLGLFAQAFADAGARFLGASSTDAVGRQKELFGIDQGFLPFVETAGTNLTWEFPGGTLVEGFQTFASLSALSGIPLPTDVISIQTNAGRLEWQLLAAEAPNTVANFLRYVNGGVDGQGYVGSILHRSDPNFVIQGGGYRPTSLTTTDIDEIQGPFDGASGNFKHHIPAFAPIPDERGPDSTSNVFGTYAMGKNSLGATSEFYFNLVDNSFLDDQGFTVFAVELDALNPDGSPNAASTISFIDALNRVDVDPSNDGTGAFSVFDNVPFTAQGEMVHIQSIEGSGTVTGTVFKDSDQDGVLDTGEAGLGGVVVFSDANGNGLPDDNELATMTAADGSYSLVLPAGSHTLLQRSDDALTTSANLAPIRVLIGQVISDANLAVASAWQNQSNPLDVSGDTFVVAQDALVIINELNNPAFTDADNGALSGRPNNAPFLDVNGDLFVSTMDVVIVINTLNASEAGTNSEGSQSVAWVAEAKLESRSGLLSTAPSSRQSPTAKVLQRDDVLAVEPTRKAPFARTVVPARTNAATSELEDLLATLAGDIAAAWFGLE